MGLESGTFVDDLVNTNPVGATDLRSQGDDHLRLIKSVLKTTFPNATKATPFVNTCNVLFPTLVQEKESSDIVCELKPMAILFPPLLTLV